MSNTRIRPIVSTSLLACAILLSFTFGFAEDSGPQAPGTFPGHSSWITSLAVSGDGEVIAAGGGETLTIKPGQASFSFCLFMEKEQAYFYWPELCR